MGGKGNKRAQSRIKPDLQFLKTTSHHRITKSLNFVKSYNHQVNKKENHRLKETHQRSNVFIMQLINFKICKEQNIDSKPKLQTLG